MHNDAPCSSVARSIYSRAVRILCDLSIVAAGSCSSATLFPTIFFGRVEEGDDMSSSSLPLLLYRTVVLTGRLSLLLQPNGEVEMKSRPLRLPLLATMDNDASFVGMYAEEPLESLR